MQCFFSSIPYDDLTVGDLRSGRYYRTQTGYLGHDDRIWGSQAAAAENPFAQLWMVYARADKRWAGADTVRFLWVHTRTHSGWLGRNWLPPILGRDREQNADLLPWGC